MNTITATSKLIRKSPRKMRLIIDELRKKDLSLAYKILSVISKGKKHDIYLLLKSAEANARNNFEIAKETPLIIEKIEVVSGPTMKRWMPRAMGRASEIKKRTCRVKVTLTPKRK